VHGGHADPVPDTPDFPALFTAGQARVVALVSALDPGDLSRPVPATPGWSVRDLLAHLAGVSADALDGEVHPESADWTAGHVRDRSDLSAEQVVDEWLRSGPRVEEMLRTAEPRPAAMLLTDLTVHEQDLRGAVGEPPLGETEVLTLVAGGLVHMLGRGLRDRDVPPLRVEADGWSAVAGRGEPGATVRTPLSELTRALAGRRSAAQVRAYDWTGDPEPYLGSFSYFGELRTHDLVE
jgi:uncharacterized protein (TIGR03083 family)